MKSLFKFKKVYFALFLAIAYTPIAIFGFQFEDSLDDENIYFYKAKLVSEGYIPYKDFFLGHPPLFTYLTAIVFKILGVSYTTIKIIPLASGFLMLLLVYALGEKYERHVGVLACLLIILSSKYFHIYSHTMRGIMAATLLNLTAFYLHVAGKRVQSGFIAAISVLTRLNSLIIFAYLTLRSILEKDKKFFYGAIATAPLLIILFIPNFVDSVILFALEEDPEPIYLRLFFLKEFFIGEKVITLLSLVGIYAILSTSKLGSGGGLLSWVRKDCWSGMIFLPVFYVLFTVLIQRRVYPSYFTLILPYLAILGGLGFKRILFSKNKIIVLAVIIALTYYLINVSSASIITQYSPRHSKGLSDSIDYVIRNSNEGESILLLQEVGGTRIALDANRSLDLDFIDPTYHFLYANRATINQTILNSLKRKPSLVSVELRTIQELIDMQVDLTYVLDCLRSEYWPVHVIAGDTVVNTIVFWKPKESVEQFVGSYDQPGGEIKYFYFERYFIPSDKRVGFIEEAVYEKQSQTAQPTIPSALNKDNPFGLMLIVSEPLVKWPIDSRAHYVVEGKEGYSSEIWVNPRKEGLIEFTGFTWWESNGQKNIISATTFKYDYEKQLFTELTCHSRLATKISSLFYTTYQQRIIPERQYLRIDELIKKNQNGSLSWDDYKILSGRILSGGI